MAGLMHIILLKLKPDTPTEAIDAIKAKFATLSEIDGVIEASIGDNITPERGQGFNLGFAMKIRDQAALAAYHPHPLHEEFKKTIAPWKLDLICHDYLL